MVHARDHILDLANHSARLRRASGPELRDPARFLDLRYATRMTPHPLRAGLAGLVDYAGLFPPASLDLPSVLARFTAYAGGEDEWMLGRLIIPLPQLGALSSYIQSLPGPVRPAW